MFFQEYFAVWQVLYLLRDASTVIGDECTASEVVFVVVVDHILRIEWGLLDLLIINRWGMVRVVPIVGIIKWIIVIDVTVNAFIDQTKRRICRVYLRIH